MAQQRILIAALNWGLGHASRCIPLIEEYQRQGAELTLASDGEALELLKREFPHLVTVDLPGYQVRYPKSAKLMRASILSQLPKLTSAITKEHKCLRQLLTQRSFDRIISDNRYGIYHEDVESIFLSHQLQIPSGRWQGMVDGLHKRMIHRFDACWVPDYPGGRLSGDLSALELSIPKRFIGPLTRMKRRKSDEASVPVLAILSGPEPQRSMLGDTLQELLSDIDGAIMVRGDMTKTETVNRDGLRVHSHLLSAELESLIARAELVICRSGYSSIMDLDAMQKRAILIPTPGQPEQEYLAERMAEKAQYTIISQSSLSSKLPGLLNTQSKC